MKTILLIEDNSEISKLVSESLKSMGYRVLYAEEPSLAVLVVKNYNDIIDLVIFDIELPIHSGIEVCNIIKEDNPNISLICISGHIDKYQDQLKELNVTVVEKPFSIDELVQKVVSKLQA